MSLMVTPLPRQRKYKGRHRQGQSDLLPGSSEGSERQLGGLNGQSRLLHYYVFAEIILLLMRSLVLGVAGCIRSCIFMDQPPTLD